MAWVTRRFSFSGLARAWRGLGSANGRGRSLNHCLTMTDDHGSGLATSAVLGAQVSDGKQKSESIDVDKEGSASRSGSSDDVDDVSSDSQHEDDNDGDKGKGVATPANPGQWQAIFSPQFNSYYFYNAETQETTWTNPLTPSDPASPSTSTSPEPTDAAHGSMDATDALDPHYAALQQAALAQGIDPGLAYLDPSLASTMPSTSAAVPGSLAFSAKFNARTGQFTRPDGRDPTHLSEFERMKRMSEFYFDVGAWEQELSGQGGSIKGDEASKKRKRPSKKDLERFKEQKRLKKIAKTAWLRT